MPVGHSKSIVCMHDDTISLPYMAQNVYRNNWRRKMSVLTARARRERACVWSALKMQSEQWHKFGMSTADVAERAR